ncbi:hypothetical protein D910_10181 [Dendroctonus ponderosae]|uniref:Sas10 C-terminal domain-containing protein n=1 Tax=Dendroctonus ponderosae TaxID=77166 RepID=U4US29_DENPD|nr:hypothetical protein D910_10181 [Dendroctonus ponderosae]
MLKCENITVLCLLFQCRKQGVLYPETINTERNKTFDVRGANLTTPCAQEFEDSEDDYDSEEDAVIRKQLRKGREPDDSDSEVGVLGVGSDHDSDEQSDIAVSDVEGQDDDDDLPDARAWGKEKKKYYGADYVDPDYGGFQGKDAHAAEVEQEEAQELQNQLMAQLDVNLLEVSDMFKNLEPDGNEQVEELLKIDLSKLTAKQKLQRLKKESPEFFVIVEDLKVKMNIAKEYLQPIVQRVQKNAIPQCKATEFVQTYYRTVLNYATNIYMYLLLKCNNRLKNHPITQRLYQYRQLLSKIEPVFEEIIKPQIDLLMDQEALEDGMKAKEEKVKSKKMRTLKLLSTLQTARKRVADDEQQPKSTKRAITYQIAKNKGLTPYRKKELRNPRVKHKMKFRKALIRRKGAVREPRRELTRYAGEISGIKAYLSKSIKIKS